MKRLLILLVVGSAMLVPSAALASGVVLKVQPSSHLVALTTTGSHVALYHSAAASRVHVGQRVTVSARRLGNGTFAASKLRVVGRASKVHFRGLLLAKSSTRWLVSAGGAVISVHRGSRTTSSARDGGPKVGSTVDVQATVGSDDELDDDVVTVVSATAPGGTIEGRLTLGTGTITVSSEHMSLVIKVPAGIDLTAFKLGDEVVADFTQGTDGSLTLTRLSTTDDNQDTNDDDQGDGGGGDGGHGGD